MVILGSPSRPRRVAVHAFAVTALVVALAGCSSDSATKLAQAKVTSQERAVAEAESAAKAATATFCTSAAAYITALDRYGDILVKTAPTVGDVTTAGKDLGQPQSDAVDAGHAAVSAQQDLTAAQQDLATAQADLAALEAAATSGSGSPTTSASTSPAPAAPNDAVARVQQAEEEFATAQRGITAGTPLKQASQQFNAAAVALEMAWLQLFSEAGCLTDAQQKDAQTAVHDYTIALQQQLADAGYYKGTVDGVYGPTTVDSVEALQKAHGLPVTGAVDKATETALQSDLAAAGGAAAQSTTASTAAVQQTLKLAGYWDGPVDGEWTAALTDALKAFQTDLGVPATGTVDAATIAAFEKAIAAQPASPSPVPTPTATPSQPASPAVSDSPTS